MTRFAAAISLTFCLAVWFAPGGAQGAQAACGRVTIAEMNWASAEFAAHVDKIVLERAFGCKVALVAGDTMPTAASMTVKGKPDIAPELWMISLREIVTRAVRQGRLKIAGEILSDGGEEGWWIPAYMLEKHPELTTLEAVMKRPDLFPHPENKSRGALHNCPSGWNCQIIVNNLYKAFGLKQAGFDLIDTGSAAGLTASLAKAYNRKQPWLGYCWAPTAALGKYRMVRLDMGVEHDAAEWDRCTGQAGCVTPKKNEWTRGRVMTVTSARFAKAAPEVFTYLSKRSWSNAVVNKMLAFMDETRARGPEAAEHFLKTHGPLWAKWLPADKVAKVRAGLE